MVIKILSYSAKVKLRGRTVVSQFECNANK